MSVHNGLYDYMEDDYTRNMLDDLQLAAELGKTLLERNKELENSLKQQQNIIEDQTQEIEYLTKQTVALREVNDSRLRIYEQLEVNIQDLERANHRLAVDNSADKKHIKSLTANIEALELKCEQLQSNIDDLTLQLELARRKSQRVSTPAKESLVGGGYTRLKRGENLQKQLDETDNRPVSPDTSCTHTEYDECVSTRKSDRCQQTQTTPKKEEPDSTEPDTQEMEQIAYLMSQLREVHTQCAKDQRRITELEEHLETVQDQTKVLERQVSQYHMKEDEMKSVQDEISSLEEVRQGHLCSRCLRTLNGDDMSLSACDDDDSSMFETMTERSQLRSSFAMEVQEKSDLGQDFLRREISIIWMMPATAFLSLFVEFCLYIKDRYILPILYKPWRYPFIFLHYILKHDKLHQI